MEISRNILERQVEVAKLLAERRAGSSLRGYLETVVIDSRPDPLPFRDVARPWQWSRADRYLPALEAVAAYRRGYTGKRAFFDVMPRGHDKTSFLGRCANWLLAFSRRPLEIVAAAADSEQAALLLSAMKREAELNSWLAPRLKFGIRKASGPGGSLQILTADAPSSFGQRTDVFIIDELTWWQKRDLFDALWSGWQKLPGAVFAVITNAGLMGSWQYEDIYKLVREDPAWDFYEAPVGMGSLPTWMRPEDTATVRRLLPRGLARRVLDNVWVDPAEDDGYLTREEVEACEQLGASLGLVYQLAGRRDREYYLSIDYGPKKDRTVLGVLHQEPDGQVLVDRLDVWQGSPEAPIQIARIREWVDEARRQFRVRKMVLDPHQLLELAQDYEQRMEVVQYEARGGKRNYAMAEALRTSVTNRRIAWYPGAGLLRTKDGPEGLAEELPRLILRPMSYGYRFDHEVSRHDDRACCLGMALVTILEDAGQVEWVAPQKLEVAPPRDPFEPRQTTPRELYGIRRPSFWERKGGFRG